MTAAAYWLRCALQDERMARMQANYSGQVWYCERARIARKMAELMRQQEMQR